MNKVELRNKWIAKTGTKSKTTAGIKRAAIKYLANRKKPAIKTSHEIDWQIWRDNQIELHAQRIMAANGMMDQVDAEMLADSLTSQEVKRVTGHSVRVAQFGQPPRAEWVVTTTWERYGRQSYSRDNWDLRITVTVAGAQESIRTGKLVLDVVNGVPVEVSIKKRPYRVLVVSDTSAIDDRIIRRLNNNLTRGVTIITNEMVDVTHPDYPLIFSSIRNVEVCKRIVDTVGIERLVQSLGLTPIDQDGDYELYRFIFTGTVSAGILKMRNPSLGCYHMEFVPPSGDYRGAINTCRDALAWRNGSDMVPSVLT